MVFSEEDRGKRVYMDSQGSRKEQLTAMVSSFLEGSSRLNDAPAHSSSDVMLRGSSQNVSNKREQREDGPQTLLITSCGSLMAVIGLGQLNIRTYNEYKLNVSDRLLGSIIRHTRQQKGRDGRMVERRSTAVSLVNNAGE